MLRRLAWTIGIAAVCLTPWAFAYGPLFPWSPAKPGYTTIPLHRADITFPSTTVLDPAYLQTDQYIADGQTFLRMPAPAHLHVIQCRTWGDFARFCPIIKGRAVGAVTLEVAGVIYVTPKLTEKRLDPGEFLRHEIAHAIVGHNVSLLNLRRMNHHSWLYEGVPVWFGRQKAYKTQEEFLQRARMVDLKPVIAFDANAPSPQTIDMRFECVAWRDFIDYLIQWRGRDVFDAFFRSYLSRPAALETIFQQAYGTGISGATDRFQEAIRSGQYRPAEY